MTLGRRALLAGLVAAGASAVFGAHLPPPHVGAIYWLGDGGRTLHGFMAIPARARGRQPAVLVLGEPGGSDPIASYALERLAAAGLVACALTRADGGGAAAAAQALADARATVRWLGTNHYAQGPVGLLAFGRGVAFAGPLLDEGGLAAAALFGAAPAAGASRTPLLALASYDRSGPDGSDGQAAAHDFTRAADFLAEHLLTAKARR